MSNFLQMLSLAMMGVFLQNTVLCGGYGASEMLRVAGKPKYTLQFFGMITGFTTLLSLSCGLLFSHPAFEKITRVQCFALAAGVLVVLYLLGVVIAKLFRARPSFFKRLGACAFNTLVLAVPLLNYKLNYSLFQSIGLGLGAGLSFVLAVLLLRAGMRWLDQNKHIPKTFQGMPALLVYVGLISLAMMAFTGHSLMS